MWRLPEPIDSSQPCIVQELLAGDLRAALSEDASGELRWLRSEAPGGCPAPGLGRAIALDIAKGLAFLHDRQVVHLDLKSPNGGEFPPPLPPSLTRFPPPPPAHCVCRQGSPFPSLTRLSPPPPANCACRQGGSGPRTSSDTGALRRIASDAGALRHDSCLIREDPPHHQRAPVQP